METPTRYIITSKSGAFTVSGDYSSCTCWFATITTVFHVLIPSTLCPTGGSIPRYRRCEVFNTIPEVQLLQEENLSSLTQLVRQKNSARTALAELNSVLASLSTTAQGFPLPVMLGCVNMLRNLNSR